MNCPQPDYCLTFSPLFFLYFTLSTTSVSPNRCADWGYTRANYSNTGGVTSFAGFSQNYGVIYANDGNSFYSGTVGFWYLRAPEPFGSIAVSHLSSRLNSTTTRYLPQGTRS